MLTLSKGGQASFSYDSQVVDIAVMTASIAIGVLIAPPITYSKKLNGPLSHEWAEVSLATSSHLNAGKVE